MERLDLRELVNVFGGAAVGKAAGGINVGSSRMSVVNLCREKLEEASPSSWPLLRPQVPARLAVYLTPRFSSAPCWVCWRATLFIRFGRVRRFPPSMRWSAWVHFWPLLRMRL